MATKQYIWQDGKFIDFNNAKVHILTHSLQYGSGIFEGIRAYSHGNRAAIFRLKEHVRRFAETAKIYSMDLGYDEEELSEAIITLVKKNRLQQCYIRPFAYYNDSRIGLSVEGKKVSVAIAAIPFGNYFDNKAKGISCKVSSWKRINSEIMPPHAKGSGNYRNSILASSEAKASGADEAIMLTSGGYVAEGPGENIFLVMKGNLVTPSPRSDILMGITRDSIIKLAEEKGLVIEERDVHREELYIAEEIFFTGTAAELTPIIKVDGKKIGSGRMGPITKLLSDAFTKIVEGSEDFFNDWLTIV